MDAFVGDFGVTEIGREDEAADELAITASTLVQQLGSELMFDVNDAKTVASGSTLRVRQMLSRRLVRFGVTSATKTLGVDIHMARRVGVVAAGRRKKIGLRMKKVAVLRKATPGACKAVVAGFSPPCCTGPGSTE